MEELLTSILNTSVQSDFSLSRIVFNLLLAFVLSVGLSMVYKNTHKGLSYSQSFVTSIVLVSVIVAAAMMIIGNSIVSAFALLGAFSIIRFRTPVKDVKDVSFIFLSLVIGMGVGTGSYMIAIVTTAFLAAIIWFMFKGNFGSARKYGYILTFAFDTKEGSEENFKRVFDQHLSSNTLLHVKTIEAGQKLDFTFNVSFKKNANNGQFVRDLEDVTGVTRVDLLTAKNDIEF